MGHVRATFRYACHRPARTGGTFDPGPPVDRQPAIKFRCLSPDAVALLEDVAARRGMSVAGYCRAAVQRALVRDLGSLPVTEQVSNR